MTEVKEVSCKDLIRTFKIQRGLAFDNLLEATQIKVEEACKKWGLNFTSTWGEYGFTLTTISDKEQSVEDGKELFKLLEPELAALLEFRVDSQCSLGACLEIFICNTSDNKWVALEISPRWVTRIVYEEDELDSTNPQYAYLCWISLPMAELLTELYNNNFKKAVKITQYLPLLGATTTDTYVDLES